MFIFLGAKDFLQFNPLTSLISSSCDASITKDYDAICEFQNTTINSKRDIHNVINPIFDLVRTAVPDNVFSVVLKTETTLDTSDSTLFLEKGSAPTVTVVDWSENILGMITVAVVLGYYLGNKASGKEQIPKNGCRILLDIFRELYGLDLKFLHLQAINI